MKSILFFDIDRTLFDPESFLNDFYSSLSMKFNLTDESLDEIKSLYKQVKLEMGYFYPSLFLDKIRNSFSNITSSNLHSLFWDELIQENLYSDTDQIIELSKVVQIGILSKGDEKFQREKLKNFKDLISDENLYIFQNKIENLQKVFDKYKDFNIYFVDDEIDVLEKAKENSNVFTILIDRKKSMKKSDKIDEIIENLYQIKDLL